MCVLLDTATGAGAPVASGAFSAFAGDVSIGPTGAVSWLHSGSGEGGGYQGGSGFCDRYHNGGSGWVHDWDWSLATSRIAYHGSGDLLICSGTQMRRYTAPATFSTVALGGTAAASRFDIAGDIVTYWRSNSVPTISTVDISTGAAGSPRGAAVGVTNIATDPTGRLAVCRGTGGIDLYLTASTSPTTTITLGAGNHHDAAWDPDGHTLWVAYDTTIKGVNVTTGVVTHTFTIGALVDCIDCIWWPTPPPSPSSGWQVRRRSLR